MRTLLALCVAAGTCVATANLSDVVSEAYYINLAEARDRNRFMRTQLARLEQEAGVSYQRFDAVSAKRDPSVRLLVAPFKDGQDPRLPLPSTKSIAALQAVLAAEMSHLRLWEHIWRTRQAAPFALILEDDARIPRNLEQHLAWLREIPEDCDMVMLGYYLMCYTDGNLTQPCDRDSHEYRDFVTIEKAVSEGGTQKALVRGPARFAGAHAYLVKVESIPRLLRHVEHIRDQVLANSSIPLKMMGTDYATDFGKDCRKYVRSPPTIQQAHDLYKTQIPTRIWMKFEAHRGQVADVSFEFSAGSIMLIGASLLALCAMSSSRFQTSCRDGDDPVVQTFLGEEPM